MVDVFCNAFVFKNYVSFLKVLFTKGVTQFGGEENIYI
jgi:hypothetical protein